MSFIYDKDLLKIFYKIAQDAAPAAPLPQSDDKHIPLAINLISKLKTQLQGGSVFSSDAPGGATIKPNNLSTLTSLFDFLIDSKIKHNGIDVIKRPTNGESELEEMEKLGYVPYPSDPNKDIIYFVHKDSLIKYLYDLKSKKIFNLNVLVDQRINDINSELKFEMSKAIPKKLETKPVIPGALSVDKKETEKKEEERKKSVTLNFDKLIGNMPLLSEAIDFTRIQNFLTKYAEVYVKSAESGESPSQPPVAYSEAYKNLGQLKSYGISIQPLVKDARVIQRSLSTRSNEIVPYIETLTELVINIGNLLFDIKSKFGEEVLSDTFKKALGQQIGYGEAGGPGTFMGDNLFILNSLLAQAQKLVQPTPVK